MKKLVHTLLAALIFIAALPIAGQAATPPPAAGMPGNARFGYGVRIDLNGLDPAGAIRLAGQVNLDWVAMDFDWKAAQPAANQPIRWGMLDSAMQSAADNGIAAMLSITNAPVWALGEDGPDSQATAELVARLVRRYPEALLALELFPRANTRQGWGADPNPQAYARLLRSASQAVLPLNPQVILVVGGLTPVASGAQDMPDSAFLDALYRAGAANFMPVVGMRLPPIGEDPLTPAGTDIQPVLRHYEALRAVMLAYQHRTGLLWITGFSWDESAVHSFEAQAQWMEGAYQLMRPQLYFGAAFFDGLNPATGKVALLSSEGSHHPGFDALVRIVAESRNRQTILIRQELSKQFVHKIHIKEKP